jgi:hypothetical protein
MIYREFKPVVTGPTSVFNRREVEMRRDAAILRHARPEIVPAPLLCASADCSAVRQPGSRRCEKCDANIEALNAWHNRPAKATGTLGNLGAIALLILMMSALAFSFWPYAMAAVRLWLAHLDPAGGAQ